MTARYEMVVGLEVHAQLATKTKLFCACPTDGFGAPPNSRICPVCTGQPGVLPVLNRRAAELAFETALALNCRIAEVSIFARKNYFYPDLPKAYQISQYELPFSSDGVIEIKVKEGDARQVRIHRVHMEEDAGKLLHAVGAEKLDCSLVDFNRAGTPLVEIVSEPDLRSSEEAYAYLTALKEILQYAGVSGCNMEKGEMRCDANVSLRPMGTEKFGVRAEIKNLNSFHNVKQALEYEFRRQAEILDSGGRVVQETRLWDAERGATASMRSKEEAHDYRYFPDPDLLPLAPEARWIERLKSELPELPKQRRVRLAAEFGLSDYDAEVLSADKDLSDYFLAARPQKDFAKALSNLMTTELLSKLNAEKLPASSSRVLPKDLGRLAALFAAGQISSKIAKELFAKMWDSGKSPDVLIQELGLSQVSDEGQIKAWVQAALAANPKAVEDLRGGKERAAGSIVGAVMKMSGGKANPAIINRLIKETVKP